MAGTMGLSMILQTSYWRTDRTYSQQSNGCNTVDFSSAKAAAVNLVAYYLCCLTQTYWIYCAFNISRLTANCYVCRTLSCFNIECDVTYQCISYAYFCLHRFLTYKFCPRTTTFRVQGAAASYEMTKKRISSCQDTQKLSVLRQNKIALFITSRARLITLFYSLARHESVLRYGSGRRNTLILIVLVFIYTWLIARHIDNVVLLALI